MTSEDCVVSLIDRSAQVRFVGFSGQSIQAIQWYRCREKERKKRNPKKTKKQRKKEIREGGDKADLALWLVKKSITTCTYWWSASLTYIYIYIYAPSTNHNAANATTILLISMAGSFTFLFLGNKQHTYISSFFWSASFFLLRIYACIPFHCRSCYFPKQQLRLIYHRSLSTFRL